MTSGMFTVPCPGCGAELDIAASGIATCPTCSTSYLSRVGHLVPVAAPPRHVLERTNVVTPSTREGA